MDPNKFLPEPGHVNREGFWIGHKYRQCTACRSIFERTNRTMTICGLCNTRRVKAKRPEYKMLQRARQRAKQRGIMCTISLEDIVIPPRCPILGIPLVVHRGAPGAFKDSPSLDRIIPSLGYVPGNVWVISQLANAMKGSASPDELRAFAAWIQQTMGT